MSIFITTKKIVAKNFKKKCYASVFLCVSIFIAACCSQANYIKMSHQITTNFEREISKKKDVTISATGGGMMDDIQLIIGRYISRKKCTIDEARKLYVEIAEGYLQRFNENEEIRPHLHDFPFTIENLEIGIGFEDENGKVFDDGTVAYVSGPINGKIYYRKYCNDKYIGLYEETYEEALKQVVCSK